MATFLFDVSVDFENCMLLIGLSRTLVWPTSSMLLNAAFLTSSELLLGSGGAEVPKF